MHSLGAEVQPLIRNRVDQLHPREVEWLVELDLGLDGNEWPPYVTTDVDSLRRWLYENHTHGPVNIHEINSLVPRL